MAQLASYAPDAWAMAASRFLEQPHAHGVRTATFVLEFLPEKQRREIVAAAARHAFAFPWIADDDFALTTIRPDDALARLRFDVGLPGHGVTDEEAHPRPQMTIT